MKKSNLLFKGCNFFDSFCICGSRGCCVPSSFTRSFLFRNWQGTNLIAGSYSYIQKNKLRSSVLGLRFLKTGGPAMISAMEKPIGNDELSVKDLVCGMMVNSKETKYKTTYQGKNYYFCSTGCREAFKENPEKYII